MTAVLRDYVDSMLKRRLEDSDSVISNYLPEFNAYTERTAAEIAATNPAGGTGITPTNYAYPPGDVRRYGAVGDSNGTTGNGTNDWQAFQSAINVAKVSSGTVFVPSPTAGDYYRITQSLDFTNASSVSFSFVGESMLDTAIFADFTSGTRVAFLNVGNTIGSRSRVNFQDFRIMGRSSSVSTKVIGIYCEYASEQTVLDNIYVHAFEEGVMVANDYATKMWNLQCVSNYGNGLRCGYLLDGVTLAASYNISVFGGDFTNNGGWGIYVFGSQDFSTHGAAFQGNVAGQIICNTCEGGGLFGDYIEHDPTPVIAAPAAQIYVINCNAFGVYGHSASAFRHDSSPIIFVETSDGITINNFNCRSTGGPFAAVGISVSDSSVTISDCMLKDVAVGVQMLSAADVTVNNCQFNNCTNSITGTATACKVVWNKAVAADVATASFNAANVVDIHYTDNTKNQIENTEAFNISVSVAELNAGGKIIIDSILPSERWRIIDIVVYNDTAFDAGGSKDVRIWDAVGAVTYATVTAANLKAASSVNRWGSAVVPFPVNADVYTPTTAQHDLRVEYGAAGVNYATGNLRITVTAMRTA